MSVVLLCHRTMDAKNMLESRIRLSKLRLTSLRYAQGTNTIGDPIARCSDGLIELCELSQTMVQLLDELYAKVQECNPGSIEHQIATQQLVYFTHEWFDRLAPELEDTFELADRATGGGLGGQSQTIEAPGTTDDDVRVKDALLKLRRSMRDNERLISAIASNIESTRVTINTIFDSLQSTKLHLSSGELNALDAIKVTRQSKRFKYFCYFVLLLAAALLVAFMLY